MTCVSFLILLNFVTAASVDRDVAYEILVANVSDVSGETPSKRLAMERKRVCGDASGDCLTVRHNGVVLKVGSGLNFLEHTTVDLLARLPCWFGPRRVCTSARKDEATEKDTELTAMHHLKMRDSAFEALVINEEVLFKLRGVELSPLEMHTNGMKRNVLKSVNPRMGEIVEMEKRKKRSTQKKQLDDIPSVDEL